jgi:hypothetical protein
MAQMRKGAGICASLTHSIGFARFLLLSVLTCGWIIPVNGQTTLGVAFIKRIESLAVKVTLNQNNLQPGQNLVVGIDVQNPDTQLTVDVFFGALFPDGKTVCFVTQASSPSCEPTTIDAGPATFPPLVKNLVIPAGLSIYAANALQLALPAGAPSGQYMQFLGVTPAGALDDGQIGPNDVMVLEFQPFSVAGTTPAAGTPSATVAADPTADTTRDPNDPSLNLGAAPFNPPIATIPPHQLEAPPR